MTDPTDPWHWRKGYLEMPRWPFDPTSNPDHPRNTGEVASKAFARLDYFTLAQFADTPEVPRGSFRHALPFLSARWNWGVSKVRRFLGKEVEAGRIHRETRKRRHDTPLVTKIIGYDRPERPHPPDPEGRHPNELLGEGLSQGHRHPLSPFSDTKRSSTRDKSTGTSTSTRYQGSERDEYDRVCPTCGVITIRSKDDVCFTCADRPVLERMVEDFERPREVTH